MGRGDEQKLSFNVLCIINIDFRSSQMTLLTNNGPLIDVLDICMSVKHIIRQENYDCGIVAVLKHIK